LRFDGFESFDDVVDGGAAVHHFHGQALGADSAGRGGSLVVHHVLGRVEGANAHLLEAGGGVGKNVPPGCS